MWGVVRIEVRSLEILCVIELMVLNSAEVSVLLQLLWTADYFLLVIPSWSLAPELSLWKSHLLAGGWVCSLPETTVSV